jgi:hypothetical protein
MKSPFKPNQTMSAYFPDQVFRKLAVIGFKHNDKVLAI